MRPLVSATRDYCATALAQGLGGLSLGIAALFTGDVVPAFASALQFALFFGGGMYLLVYRRVAQQALADATEPPTQQREPSRRTTARVARTELLSLALAGAVAVPLQALTPFAGISIGNAVALWWLGVQLHRRERDAGVRLWREPRWRWPHGGTALEDFYVEAGDAA